MNIDEAVKKLKQGDLIGLPTETVYGLAASISSLEAIHKLYTLKGRPQEKPLAIAISQPRELVNWVKNIPKMASQVIEVFWPGPLTIVLPCSAKVPQMIVSNHFSVGIRCSSCALTNQVIEALGNPICLSSANISGRKDALTAQEVLQYFPNEMVLAADHCIGGLPSTVIDFSLEPYRLLRVGAISKEEIQEVIKF